MLFAKTNLCREVSSKIPRILHFLMNLPPRQIGMRHVVGSWLPTLMWRLSLSLSLFFCLFFPRSLSFSLARYLSLFLSRTDARSRSLTLFRSFVLSLTVSFCVCRSLLLSFSLSISPSWEG